MIVTISREYGAAGLAVAERSAHTLGYDLLTDDLPQSVAERLGTSAEEIASRENAEATFGERILASLDAGTPQTVADASRARGPDFDESVRREIERTIRERAARDNVVILGRYANALLGPRPDVVRAFLIAPQEWRVARLAETFGWTHDAARAACERIDPARQRLAKDRYGFRWGDPHFYDVVLDVSRTGIDGACAMILSAVSALGFEPSS